MRSRYIPAFVMLLAGSVTVISSIVMKFDKSYSIKLLFAVLIVFYIIGIIAMKIIVRVLKPAIVPVKTETEETIDVSEDNVTEE